jgi:flagellar motor protein MotB
MADESHGSHDEHKGHKSHGGGHGGHGGGGHAEGEHEGAPEWLISFADNVALLMGFFVILLAMNMKEPTNGGIGGKDAYGKAPNDSEMLDLVISIREAFNNPVNPQSADPRDAALVQRIRQKKQGDAKQDGPPGDKPDVQSVRPTDYFRVGGVVTFEEGSVAVDEDGERTAASVAKELQGRKTILEVRGHASLAEASEPLDRGMSLAFQRALGVAQVLRTAGIEWDQMRVVSCGAADRVKPLARSAREHQNNQRVEIIITDELMPSDPYARDPNAAEPATASAHVAE